MEKNHNAVGAPELPSGALTSKGGGGADLLFVAENYMKMKKVRLIRGTCPTHPVLPLDSATVMLWNTIKNQDASLTFKISVRMKTNSKRIE